MMVPRAHEIMVCLSISPFLSFGSSPSPWIVSLRRLPARVPLSSCRAHPWPRSSAALGRSAVLLLSRHQGALHTASGTALPTGSVYLASSCLSLHCSIPFSLSLPRPSPSPHRRHPASPSIGSQAWMDSIVLFMYSFSKYLSKN